MVYMARALPLATARARLEANEAKHAVAAAFDLLPEAPLHVGAIGDVGHGELLVSGFDPNRRARLGFRA
jgi:hypothetical protein